MALSEQFPTLHVQKPCYSNEFFTLCLHPKYDTMECAATYMSANTQMSHNNLILKKTPQD